MRPDLEPEVLRGQVEPLHSLEFQSQLFRRTCYVRIPAEGLLAEPQSTEIPIAVAIAEPSPHLQERVVHLGVAEEVRGA